MHLNIKKATAVMALSLTCLVANAQKTITGTVKDASGEPLIGVSVMAGNGEGAVTDIDGHFSINNLKPGQTLKLSYVGYRSSTVTVGDDGNIVVVLKEDNQNLDEVVVVGYGTMKKRDLTGSISSIKSKDLENLASANAMQAMQSKVPGLDITQSSGQAGGPLKINLRGTRSILASNNLLSL